MLYILYIIHYYFSKKILNILNINFKYYNSNKESYVISKNFIAFENNRIILIFMVNIFNYFFFYIHILLIYNYYL